MFGEYHVVLPNAVGQAEATDKSVRVRFVSAGWRAAIATLYAFIMLVLFLTTIGAPPLHESLFQSGSPDATTRPPPPSLLPNGESREVHRRQSQPADQSWWAQA